MMADMMAKDPAQRIASAREVQTRLAPFATAGSNGEVVTANGQTPLHPLRLAIPTPPPIVAQLGRRTRFVAGDAHSGQRAFRGGLLAAGDLCADAVGTRRHGAAVMVAGEDAVLERFQV